jgi:hypothetical protein
MPGKITISPLPRLAGLARLFLPVANGKISAMSLPSLHQSMSI